MLAEVQKGDAVTITYVSKRSENEVSRTGTVRRVPTGDSNILFVETDEDQLTSVNKGHAFSISVGRDDETGKRTVQRTTYLGPVKSVTN